jgi:hypothetical protein
MKRFLFAAALAALFTGSASADDKPAAPATPAPAVTAAPVAEMTPATTSSGTRRGLIARLRDRRGGSTTTSAPMMATPTMTAPPVAAPMPMPGTTVPKPMPSGGTTGSTLTPAGGTITEGAIVTAGYSEPATTARRGLFSRIRNR